MAIHFLCPACGKIVQVADQFANQKARCACGALVLVPGKATSRPKAAAAGSRTPIVRRAARTASEGKGQRWMVGITVAGILLAIISVAAVLATKHAPSSERIVTKQARAVLGADKSRPPPGDAGGTKRPPGATESKPKADVQAPPPAPPVDKSRDTARDALAAKPKRKNEAETPNISPPPPPADADAATVPVDEAVPIAGTQFAAKPGRFSAIDKHALKAPRDAEQSVTTLAAYLVKPARDDLEKVRAIYRWITDRVAYDSDSFFEGRPVDGSPEMVFKRRLAVCEGYARLFKAMCNAAKVEAVVITGYGKGVGYEPSKNLKDFGHAWNAVKLQGAWYLLDATWAAGSIQRSGFVKMLNDYQFLTPPDQFVFRHLPRDPRWQLLREPLSQQQVEALPMVDDTLFAGGITSQQIKKTVQRKTFRGLVKAYYTFGFPLVIRQAPLDGHLVAGSTLTVRIEGPQFPQMAITNEGQVHSLTKNGNVFTGSMKVQKGTVRVGAILPGKGEMYWSILEYVVDDKTKAARVGF